MGRPSHEVATLLAPALWTPAEEETPAPLLQAVLDSRKGQAELSKMLGERVAGTDECDFSRTKAEVRASAFPPKADVAGAWLSCPLIAQAV